MNKGRKRATITPENEIQIYLAAMAEPRKQRTKLAEELQGSIKWKDSPPEVEVLEKKISEYRNNITKGPEDMLWSTLTMWDGVISSEDLPVVLRAWVYTRASLKVNFTIRNAKWVARLRCVIPDIVMLTVTARRYSDLEIMYKLNPRRPVNVALSDVMLYLDLTGKEATDELYEAISSPHKDRWLVREKKEKFENDIKGVLANER